MIKKIKKTSPSKASEKKKKKSKTLPDPNFHAPLWKSNGAPLNFIFKKNIYCF